MSSDINVQTFSGKVNITSNLLVGSSHLFVDTINNRVGLVTTTPDAGIHVNSNAYVHTDFRVGSGIVMNDTSGRITAGSFVGDGSAMTGINSDSGSWVNGANSNVHLATSTDKVGIGTSSPEAKLHLYQSAGSTNLVEKHTNASTGDYQQHINYTHYASVAGGTSRDPDNSRGLWIGNMVDENDASPSGANFAAFTDSFQFYAVADRTKYDSSLSFTSNTDNLLYSGGTFNKVMRISADGNVTATTFTGALSGNASTATTLQTARTIGGVSFDGSANITPTTFGGATFSGDVAFDTNTLFVDVSANRVGIGTTAPSSPLHVSASTTSTHTMRITHTDTNATSGTHALLIDANYSGSDTFTGDKANAGLYIDLDSSATGGGTAEEHRIYGVYSDVRHSGDSDICYSGYFYARSDHTTGQCSALRGIYAEAQDSANGTNSNNTAGEFKALKDGGSTNTTATMMGVRAEVEVDAGTVTNAYAVHGHIDRDGGTITNGYLFHGSYAGTDTGVKWGLHLTGDEKNHVDGSFGIGTDAPGAKLDVSGNVRVSTPSSYNPALQLGTQTSYNDDQLYSLRWGGSTLMGMGLHSSTRGVFGKQGLAIHIPDTEEFSVKTNGWTNLFAVDGATGHVYCGNTVYIGGSTSRGLRGVSGNYGTVQTTGEGAGNHEGYSINGRWVFMSADANTCGIFNDTDGDWAIICYRNGKVRLDYNGVQKFYTESGGATVVGELNADAISARGTGSFGYNWDGVFMRPDGQVYISVDDNFYFRDNSSTSSNLRRHLFDTNNGRIYAEGTVYSNHGLDYAEYFEWFDGNPDNEDRIGCSVSLVENTNKIKKCEPGEIPLGVVSGTSSMTGGGAGIHWNGYWKNDEWGRATYKQLEDDNGELVFNEDGTPKMKRAINPEYDENLDSEYLTRDQRKEWACVGLLGQVFVKKGGVTSKNWIKMKEVDSVKDLWFINAVFMDNEKIETIQSDLQAEKVKTRELEQKLEILEMSHASLIQRIEALEKL